MTRRSLALALLLVGAGCRTEPVARVALGAPEAAPATAPKASPDAVTAAAAARRSAEVAARPVPRLPLDQGYDDPVDDPELVEEYYSGLPEADGAAVDVAPPPRPTGLPGNRSFSIGPPNAGWLMGGKALPLRGPHHRVLRGTEARDWYWGTDRLVELIQHAAAEVALEHGGAPLRVGNLSRAEGGKIRPSVSHQSGRDADIGIYSLDLDGNSVDAPGFPRFREVDGQLIDTTGRYLFDVARNWSFVAALLGSDRARIQWIFLDDPLKDALLDYAVRTRVDAKLIDRAEKVIVRPKNSSPHADHYHIRIFCTDGDLEFGCRDYGPEWDWVKADRELDRALIQDRIDRIMRGEATLDLSDGGTVLKVDDVVADPGAPTSPEDLPDPPTDIEINL